MPSAAYHLQRYNKRLGKKKKRKNNFVVCAK